MKRHGKRWTAAYAGDFLDKADRAQSDRGYAEARGVAAQRLAWWRKRLGRPRPRRRPESRATSSAPGFVEVTVKRPTSATTLEVSLTNGRQFRISGPVDATEVGQLADALEGRC